MCVSVLRYYTFSYVRLPKAAPFDASRMLARHSEKLLPRQATCFVSGRGQEKGSNRDIPKDPRNMELDMTEI